MQIVVLQFIKGEQTQDEDSSSREDLIQPILKSRIYQNRLFSIQTHNSLFTTWNAQFENTPLSEPKRSPGYGRNDRSCNYQNSKVHNAVEEASDPT